MSPLHPFNCRQAFKRKTFQPSKRDKPAAFFPNSRSRSFSFLRFKTLDLFQTWADRFAIFIDHFPLLQSTIIKKKKRLLTSSEEAGCNGNRKKQLFVCWVIWKLFFFPSEKKKVTKKKSIRKPFRGRTREGNLYRKSHRTGGSWNNLKKKDTWRKTESHTPMEE